MCERMRLCVREYEYYISWDIYHELSKLNHLNILYKINVRHVLYI